MIILGPRNLQNSVLSTFINTAGAFSCEILSSSSDIQKKQPYDEILVLVDVSTSASYLDLLNPLCETSKIALINAEENEEGLYEILHRFELRGVFLKTTTPEQFVQGITAIFADEYWLSRKLTAKIFSQIKQEKFRNLSYADGEDCICDLLTSKESKILEAIVDGHTNRDIADKTFLSPHTVKTHIYNLYKKIGVTNRVQAVNWARKHLKKEIED
ncbi:MAG: response regulator transcription factor [Gammaproteobacteria bacterium]